MKRIASLMFSLLLVLCFYTSVLAASVPPQTFPGNDANDYTPPDGCLHYQIPNSDSEGSHTITFDNNGALDSDEPPIWIFIVSAIFLIISTVLLGILVFLMYLLLFGASFNIFGSCIRRFHKKSCNPKKPNHHDKGKDCNKNEDKDCEKKEDKDNNSNHPNGHCDEKYDPSKGYSLDCNKKSTFPYYNKYNKFF